MMGNSIIIPELQNHCTFFSVKCIIRFLKTAIIIEKIFRITTNLLRFTQILKIGVLKYYEYFINSIHVFL